MSLVFLKELFKQSVIIAIKNNRIDMSFCPCQLIHFLDNKVHL